MILEYDGVTIGENGEMLDPVQLPPFTLRFRFYNESLDPNDISSKGTWTKVQSSTHNDWDWTYDSTNWNDGPFSQSYLGNKYRTGLYDVIAAGDNRSVWSCSLLFGVDPSWPSVEIDGVTKTVEEWMDGNGPVHCCNLNVSGNLVSGFCCCHQLQDVAALYSNNLGNNTFRNCTSLTSVPRFIKNYIDNSTASYTLRGTFAGCTSLNDISNLRTLERIWTQKNESNRGLDLKCGSFSTVNDDLVAGYPGTFGDIPNPLFSITGNEFSSDVPIKELGGTSSTGYYRTLFFNSGLPNGWINVLKWPLHSSSLAKGIGSNRGLTSIPTIPNGIISTGFDIAGFFAGNPDVETGMLAAYQALSAITPNGSNCFTGTGTNTVQGMADRAQIPTSWGGDYVVQDLYVATGWSKWKNSSSLGTLWQCTSYNVDFSTLQSMQIYTESSVSSYAGVNMRKTNIGCRRGNFSNSTSSPCYYWPAFMQFSGNGGASDLIWILVSTGYNGTLGAGSSAGDMPGTLSYNTFGNHSVQIGTYVPNYDKPTGFGFLVTNTDTLDSSCLTNFGILYNSNFYADPVLRAVTSTVTPQSAIINS